MGTNAEAIAEVNHWRGQCLDNFARAEKAIVSALVEIRKSRSDTLIHEAAAHRTRDLALFFKQQPKADAAAKVAKSLEYWSLRDKQRNQIAHGCFTVHAHDTQEWALKNEIAEVKKNVVVTTGIPLTKLEADAFLQAIIGERKNLERQIKAGVAAL